MTVWSGRVVGEARAYMAQRLPAHCGQCGITVTAADQWVVGHIKSRALRPDLTMVPSNWRVEHRTCSDASSQSVVQEKAKVDALRLAGFSDDEIELILTAEPPSFSPDRVRPQSPPLPRSLSDDPEPLTVNERLRWDTETLSAYPWLHDLLLVPGDAAVPLAMTPPHPDAVGSYGAEAIAWIEQTERKTLRWWQRLAITRQLEHDASGRLVWRVIVESAPRRAGKSVRLRGVALWRLEHGTDLFGESQLVIHTGKDVNIVREIQRFAWRWAEDVAGWIVTRGNGKESLETPDGNRWLARAMHSVYGYDVALGMVDEAWSVDPAAVDEGLEPATMERSSPQLHLTSTAHRRSTSLMRRRIGDALGADDGSTLLMLWAAAPGSDPGSEETWKAASPHWSEDRREMIASKYEKALAGEIDPEADDLDPMAGFTAQYLNQWVLKRQKAVAGTPVVTEVDWRGLREDLPSSRPLVVAVEGWPGEGVSVASAWRSGANVVVSVTDVPDVATAAEIVAGLGAPKVLVGASLANDPAWTVRVTPETGAVRTSVMDLARMLGDGVLRHDGGDHLSSQVTGLRTSPGSDGLRIRSAGRADAIKAAVWAVQAVRKKSLGKPRIVVAA